MIKKRVKPVRTASQLLRKILVFADAMPMTQKALEQKLNMANKLLSRWRAGRVSPSVLTVEELADALDLEIIVKKRRKKRSTSTAK